MRRDVVPILAVAVAAGLAGLARADEGNGKEAGKVFRAGAAAVDVSPPKLPVRVNGGFLEQQADAVRDPLYARALVLDDGTTRIAVVVVDSCMLPRALIDRARQTASRETGIPAGRMLVSATHTHSAPSAMGALGSRPDPDYVAFLPGRIAEAVAKAAGRLRPARIGWAVVDDPEHTHCRRWIRRPDRLLTDPFGDRTVRANMHPGYQNPDVIGPSGPVDPALSVLAVRAADGRPLAVLANYSMHYFGDPPVSADYFGRFAARLAGLVGPGAGDAPCVVMMSQGTSGDQHWMDYARPATSVTIDAYAEAVARKADEAFRKVEYRPWVSLAMAETRLTLRRRAPDEKRLAWARSVVAVMGNRMPKSQPEVYAREAIDLHDEPERELTLQAIRIGDLGIAAIPDEVFALTGLKVKARSPLTPTFVMELANGSEGYIPPPEQHALGGYTTWPARTAALETQAEPRVVAAVLGLLEEVSGRPRRSPRDPAGAYAGSVLASKPLAYWRLAEMEGSEAADATGQGHPARYRGGFALYLEGPPSPGFSGEGAINRAAHLAGGYLDADLPALGAAYCVELWFWNGLPSTARAVTGVLFSRGPEGDRLAIGGTRSSGGRLAYGLERGPAGTTEITPKTWHHAAFVRNGDAVTLYLDGKPEATGRAPARPGEAPSRLRIGGGGEPDSSFEGKLDEVAVYGRALTPAEVAEHFRNAGTGP